MEQNGILYCIHSKYGLSVVIIEILKFISFVIFVVLSASMALTPFAVQNLELWPMSVIGILFLYVLYKDASEPPSWKCESHTKNTTLDK